MKIPNLYIQVWKSNNDKYLFISNLVFCDFYKQTIILLIAFITKLFNDSNDVIFCPETGCLQAFWNPCLRNEGEEDIL